MTKRKNVSPTFSEHMSQWFAKNKNANKRKRSIAKQENSDNSNKDVYLVEWTDPTTGQTQYQYTTDVSVANRLNNAKVYNNTGQEVRINPSVAGPRPPTQTPTTQPTSSIPTITPIVWGGGNTTPTPTSGVPEFATSTPEGGIVPTPNPWSFQATTIPVEFQDRYNAVSSLNPYLDSNRLVPDKIFPTVLPESAIRETLRPVTTYYAEPTFTSVPATSTLMPVINGKTRPLNLYDQAFMQYLYGDTLPKNLVRESKDLASNVGQMYGSVGGTISSDYTNPAAQFALPEQIEGQYSGMPNRARNVQELLMLPTTNNFLGYTPQEYQQILESVEYSKNYLAAEAADRLDTAKEIQSKMLNALAIGNKDGALLLGPELQDSMQAYRTAVDNYNTAFDTYNKINNINAFTGEYILTQPTNTASPTRTPRNTQVPTATPTATANRAATMAAYEPTAQARGTARAQNLTATAQAKGVATAYPQTATAQVGPTQTAQARLDRSRQLDFSSFADALNSNAPEYMKDRQKVFDWMADIYANNPNDFADVIQGLKTDYNVNTGDLLALDRYARQKQYDKNVEATKTAISNKIEPTFQAQREQNRRIPGLQNAIDETTPWSERLWNWITNQFTPPTADAAGRTVQPAGQMTQSVVPQRTATPTRMAPTPTSTVVQPKVQQQAPAIKAPNGTMQAAQQQAQAVVGQLQNKAVARWAPNGSMQAAQQQAQAPKIAPQQPNAFPAFDPSKMGNTTPPSAASSQPAKPKQTTGTSGSAKLARQTKLKKDISVASGLTAHATQPVKESPMPKKKTTYGGYARRNRGKYVQKQIGVMFPRQTVPNVMPHPPARKHAHVRPALMSHEQPFNTVPVYEMSTPPQRQFIQKRAEPKYQAPQSTRSNKYEKNN